MMGTLGLSDGRVLVYGGGARTLELFDPKSRTWRPAGRLKQDAVGVAGVQLADGRVYLAGGELTDRRAMSKAAALWDPKTRRLTGLPPLKQGLRGMAFLTDDGKLGLLAKLAEGDRPKLFVTDPRQGTLEPLAAKGLELKALKELGRSKGEVLLAHGPDGRLIRPPTGLRGAALLRFFPSRRSWRTLAKLDHDRGSGGAVVALSADRILVLGGAAERDSAVELCTPEAR